MQADNADTIRQLKNLQNQIIMAGEATYIALAAMEIQEDGLERQLAALDRQLTELDLRYELGHVSSMAVKQAKSGRAALSSGLSTLGMNLNTYKGQLELLMGAEITGELSLGALPAVAPEELEAMDLGPLFGLWFQSMFVGITMWALTICIFIITYGRMIEVYLVTSVAPIPMAAMMGKEFGGMGQNYLKSLFALGFQAFLIMICVGIYAVLVQGIATSGDISAAIWTCMGYTVLLCFTLFKTGSLAKSVFSAH